jgi:hypothetical protein
VLATLHRGPPAGDSVLVNDFAVDGGAISALFRVARQDRAQIQLLTDRLAHKVLHVPGRNQLLNRRWQQPPLLNAQRSKDERSCS